MLLMSATKRAAAKAGTADTARQAWGLLSGLVYPPPFIAIARQLDLRPASFGAVRALDRPRPMSEIAEVLHCDNSNVTGIVDGLEERGLAVRRPSDGDRRVRMIELTDEGRRLRARLIKAAEEPPAWLKGLSEADQLALHEVLRRAVEETG